MIEIRKYNRAALLEFIHSEAFRTMPEIPISYHRAISHIHNPKLSEEDVLLFLAFEEEHMLGYLGSMPDFYFDKQGVRRKVYWLTCLWVDPNQRGKQIAQKLLNSAIAHYQEALLITDFTPVSTALYEKWDLFKKQYHQAGVRLYVQADFVKLLLPKFPFLQHVQSIIKGIDFMLNVFIKLKNSFWKPALKQVQVTELSTFDEASKAFIDKQQAAFSFARTAADISWMLDYPWVIAGDKNSAAAKRFYFSAMSEDFFTKIVQVKDKSGNIIAILILQQREGHLKIPFCYIDGEILAIASVVEYYLKAWNIKYCTIYEARLSALFLSKSSPFYLHKKMTKSYFISAAIADSFAFDARRMQAGDGDSAFT